MDTANDILSGLIRNLEAITVEAHLLLQQQREVMESNISDLNQRVDRERLEKLGKETAKLRLSLKQSRAAERRRKELETVRKRRK